jgi:hypothetical protein
LAKAAAQVGAWLVHYSTDYVFDGSGNHARQEGEGVGPLSVYGQTKHEGEQAIFASGCSYLIFRTSWVYAARGGNFAKTMLRLAQDREKLAVINDQHGAPTGAELIADVTAHAIRRLVNTQNIALGGVYPGTLWRNAAGLTGPEPKYRPIEGGCTISPYEMPQRLVLPERDVIIHLKPSQFTTWRLDTAESWFR